MRCPSRMVGCAAPLLSMLAACGGGGGDGGGGPAYTPVVLTSPDATLVLTTLVQNVTSVTVTEAAAGTIVAQACGSAAYNNAGAFSVAEIYLSTSPTGQDNPVEVRLPAGEPAGLYGVGFADLAVFPFAGGSTTIHLNAYNSTGTGVTLNGARLVVRFYPAGTSPIAEAPEGQATLTNLTQTVTQASLTAPGAGWLVVDAAGGVRHDYSAAAFSSAEIYLSPLAATQDEPIESRLAPGLANGLFGFPFGNSAVLPVAGPGLQYAYLNGFNLGSTSTEVLEGRMVARFVPQAAPDFQAAPEANSALPTSVGTIASVNLVVPASGYVLVQATGIVRHNFAAGAGASVAEIYVSENATGQDNAQEARVPATLPAGIYGFPFLNFAVFPASAGPHTYRLNGLSLNGAQAPNAIEVRLMATYFAP